MATALQSFFGGDQKATLFVTSLVDFKQSGRKDVENSLFGQLMRANVLNNQGTQHDDDINEGFMTTLVNAGLFHGELERDTQNLGSATAQALARELFSDNLSSGARFFINQVVGVVGPNGALSSEDIVAKLADGSLNTAAYKLAMKRVGGDQLPALAKWFPDVSTTRTNGEQRKYLYAGREGDVDEVGFLRTTYSYAYSLGRGLSTAQAVAVGAPAPPVATGAPPAGPPPAGPPPTGPPPVTAPPAGPPPVGPPPVTAPPAGAPPAGAPPAGAPPAGAPPAGAPPVVTTPPPPAPPPPPAAAPPAAAATAAAAAGPRNTTVENVGSAVEATPRPSSPGFVVSATSPLGWRTGDQVVIQRDLRDAESRIRITLNEGDRITAPVGEAVLRMAPVTPGGVGDLMAAIRARGAARDAAAAAATGAAAIGGGQYGGTFQDDAHTVGQNNASTWGDIVNWPRLLRNTHAAMEQCDEVAQEDELDYCNDQLDIEFLDLAYNKTWKFDSVGKTFYRMVNGKRISYLQDLENESNCYGTYLGTKSGDNRGQLCKSLIECLVSDDPRSLSNCMALLADQDLWKIAADDAQRVNPGIVKSVLRKFQVQGKQRRDDRGVTYKVPMTFDEWERNILNVKIAEPARSAIKNNQALLDYLKGLLFVCDANPAIINKFQPALSSRGLYPDGESMPKTEYVTRLSKNIYYDPRSSDSDFAVAAAQLRALPYGTLSPTMFSSQLGSLNNASFYSNQRSPVSFGGAYAAQTGGDMYGVGNRFFLTSGTRLAGQNLSLKDGSGSTFTGLFKAIDAGLSDMGVAMDQQDRRRIDAAIKKLVDIESKLISLVRKFSIAVRIGETIGAHHYSVDRQSATPIKLTDVATDESARRFMQGHTRELRDAYESLHGHYSNIATDLVTRVAPRLMDRCCETTQKREEEFVELSDC
jgi:hypothetical protein